MSQLRCTDFFAIQIDPDEPPAPELVPSIEEHRRKCQDCRELEEAYPEIVRLGRSLPDDRPLPSEDFEEELMKVAHEVCEKINRPKRRQKIAKGAGLVLVFFLLSIPFASSERNRSQEIAASGEKKRNPDDQEFANGPGMPPGPTLGGDFFRKEMLGERRVVGLRLELARRLADEGRVDEAKLELLSALKDPEINEAEKRAAAGISARLTEALRAPRK